jgi:hypothetical protein
MSPVGWFTERKTAMRRSEILWLAFEKFAIFFSFAVTFSLVMALILLAFGVWTVLPALQSLKDGLACETIVGLNTLVDDFEDAVITRTIHISQTIPVRFDLPLERSLTVKLTKDVPVNRPATFVLPAGGGQINGTVYMMLPTGQNLPIRMSLTVPVDKQLPVEMDVPVSIPLKETDLGNVIAQLRKLLEPLQLDKLEEVLDCQGR